jgi:hypothetical protein
VIFSTWLDLPGVITPVDIAHDFIESHTPPHHDKDQSREGASPFSLIKRSGPPDASGHDWYNFKALYLYYTNRPVVEKSIGAIDIEINCQHT